jgi:hypothetical protein
MTYIEKKKEWDVFLDHARSIIWAIRAEKGAWYVRTLLARWLEEMDNEEDT